MSTSNFPLFSPDTPQAGGAWSPELLKAMIHALDQSPVAILIATPQGVVEYINQRFCAIHHCSSEQACGQPVHQVPEARLRPEQLFAIWDTVRQGTPWHDELRLPGTDGRHCWVRFRFSPVQDPSGQLVHVMAVEEDITPRKEAEMILRDSEEKLRQILAGARDAIIIIDEDCHVQLWNQAATRMFGFELEEVLGRDLNELTTPARSRTTMRLEFQRLHSLTSTASIDHMAEYWAQRKDQSEILVETAFSGLTLKGRWHALLIARDATERKKTEAERELLIRSLEEALDSVKTLRGMVPICASCKKIRDDKGYWNQVEAYVSAHSEAKFSHGICPDCARKLYPEFAPPKPGSDVH